MKSILAALVTCGALALGSAGAADLPADYFKNKTIRITVAPS